MIGLKDLLEFAITIIKTQKLLDAEMLAGLFKLSGAHGAQGAARGGI